jgi:hypothetical protein
MIIRFLGTKQSGFADEKRPLVSDSGCLRR